MFSVAFVSLSVDKISQEQFNGFETNLSGAFDLITGMVMVVGIVMMLMMTVVVVGMMVGVIVIIVAFSTYWIPLLSFTWHPWLHASNPVVVVVLVMINNCKWRWKTSTRTYFYIHTHTHTHRYKHTFTHTHAYPYIHNTLTCSLHMLVLRIWVFMKPKAFWERIYVKKVWKEPVLLSCIFVFILNTLSILVFYFVFSLYLPRTANLCFIHC